MKIFNKKKVDEEDDGDAGEFDEDYEPDFSRAFSPHVDAIVNNKIFQGIHG
jgi:hypothetical protein